MESERSSMEKVTRWISQPRVRGFAIAVVALVSLVVLQVNQRQDQPVMCELLEGCQLQTDDIQRMQIAFSREGLSGFEIRNSHLYVPSDLHREFMEAASEANAIPSDLRSEENSTPVANPFLSRPQQQAIELERKKQQIRSMVARLPFVEQAYFEMDRADSGSAFQPDRQSAVVLIRSKDQIALTERHVDTVRKMIRGAVADLNPDQIEVIDLKIGLAHTGVMDEATQHQLKLQQVAFSQQRFYENRVREALAAYPGLDVSVQVDLQEYTPETDRVAKQASPVVPEPVIQLPAPGANGMASIEIDTPPNNLAIQTVSNEVQRGQSPFQLAGHRPVAPSSEYRKYVTVTVDVAAEMVDDLQPPSEPTPGLTPKQKLQSQQSDRLARFQAIESRLTEEIARALPAETELHQNLIDIQLIESPAVMKSQSPWWQPVQAFALQNWPSAAVLVVGLGLMMVVTRTPTPVARPPIQENEDRDVLSINPSVADASETEKEPARPARSDVQLSQLIEEDPDAAARIIETWIRDAV